MYIYMHPFEPPRPTYSYEHQTDMRTRVHAYKIHSNIHAYMHTDRPAYMLYKSTYLPYLSTYQHTYLHACTIDTYMPT